MSPCACPNQLQPHDWMPNACPPEDAPPCGAAESCCHGCDVCWMLGCRYDEWIESRSGEAPP